MPCGWTLNVRVHLLQSHVSWNLQKLQTWTPGRVGHFILRAVAIQAINPQNALTRINFHSPKSSIPTPSWSCCSHGRPACHFAGNFLILSFSYSVESRAAFRFFLSFLFNDFENSGNILLKLINYSCSSYPTRASYSGRAENTAVFATISNTGFLQSRVFNSFFIGFLKSCKFS